MACLSTKLSSYAIFVFRVQFIFIDLPEIRDFFPNVSSSM